MTIGDWRLSALLVAVLVVAVGWWVCRRLVVKREARASPSIFGDNDASRSASPFGRETSN